MPIKPLEKNSTRKIGALFILVVLNCLFSVYNKYPILYSDTSTYLSSGFELEAPFDRPITYGILLRIFSLNGVSLYFVPFFQNLIFLYVLYSLLRVFFNAESLFSNAFKLVIVLALATGFNWCINELLPDFLTSIGALSLFCIYQTKITRREKISHYIIFFVCAASHVSNVFIYLLIILGLVIFRRRLMPDLTRKIFYERFAVSVSVLLISFVIMASAISKSKAVFFSGSLAQKGILQKILKDNCKINSFKLCAYADSIPNSFEYFVWNSSSPLYKIGGWKSARKELSVINSLSLSNIKYIKMQAAHTFQNFFLQLYSFNIGEGNGAFSNETILMKRIKNHVKFDKFTCENSLQNRNGLAAMEDILNRIYALTTTFAVLLFFWLYFKHRNHFNTNVKTLIFFVFVLIAANAFTVAYTSEVSNRHGCKLVWLFTLINYIILAGGNWGIPASKNNAQR